MKFFREYQKIYQAAWLSFLLFVANTAWSVSFKDADLTRGKSVGVYLGTFDPFTLGHQEVAEFALKNGLDYVLVIPRDITLHKPGSTPVVIKLEMLKTVIGNHPKLVYPGSEFRIPNIFWYTGILKKRGVRLVGLIGEDILRESKSQKLNTTAMLGHVEEFWAFRRSTDPLENMEQFAERPLRIIDIPASARKFLTASSSKVRKFLSENRTRFYLDADWSPSEQELPIAKALRDFIRREKLYHPNTGFLGIQCLKAKYRVSRLLSFFR